MAINLYDVLGVSPNADTKTIRRAYRDKAKKTHPDAGGSPKEFALVKRAVDVLSDEARRAQYDQTGDDAGPAPDNEMAEIMQLISTALDKAVHKMHQNGSIEFVMGFDVLMKIKAELNDFNRQNTAAIEDLERANLLNTDLAPRFKRKHEDQKPNFLASLMAGRAAYAAGQIANRKKMQEKIVKALEFLSEYQFETTKMSASEEKQLRNIAIFGGFGSFVQS